MLSIYRLPQKLSGEKIIKIIRRDRFIIFKRIVFFIFKIVLFIAFLILMRFIYPSLFSGIISGPLIMLGISAYALFIWLFFFFSFIDYYLDIWVVTNYRIIDIEQRGFFSRVIAEQKLSRVQDVTSETHGFFATIFKFGNVHVQTAGAKERFVLEDVPHPQEIRNMMINLANQDNKAEKQKKLIKDKINEFK